MRAVRSILFECNGYRGKPSYERRRAVEEHVKGRVDSACGLESATMREIDVGGGILRVTVELVYTKGNCREIIPLVDSALLDVGVAAFKAVVSSVASHAAEAVISGTRRTTR